MAAPPSTSSPPSSTPTCASTNSTSTTRPPTSRQGPAMDETRTANAMAYGMMAAEPGIDVLCLGEMGIANTTAAATLCAALLWRHRRRLGRPRHRRQRPGAGRTRSPSSTRRWPTTRTRSRARDPLDHPGRRRRRGTGGHRRRHRRRPHGPHPGAARRLCLHGRRRGAARRGPPRARPLPGRPPLGRARPHAAARQAINQRPLLDLDMRLGEASGAALAVPLLKAAAACHNGMATFAEAGVSSKDA